MIDLSTVICECCIVVECCLPGSNSGRRHYLLGLLFGVDRHHSTWSRFSLSDIGITTWYGWWLFPSKLFCVLPVLFLGLLIFQLPLFSDEVGPYVGFQRSLINWFSLWVRICFTSSLILHMWSYSVVAIKIVWSKYVNWNILHTYQCMYHVLFAIVLFWQIILSYFYGTINEPIFYTLYFYADITNIVHFRVIFFLWHLFRSFIKSLCLHI